MIARPMTAPERRFAGLSMADATARVPHVPDGRERLHAWQAALTSRSDYDHTTRMHNGARGLSWLRDLLRRPIPRHRALVICTEAGPYTTLGELAGEAAADAENRITDYAARRGE